MFEELHRRNEHFTTICSPSS